MYARRESSYHARESTDAETYRSTPRHTPLRPVGRTKNETKRNLRLHWPHGAELRRRERDRSQLTGRLTHTGRALERDPTVFAVRTQPSAQEWTQIYILYLQAHDNFRTYSTRRYALGYSEPAVNAYSSRAACALCAQTTAACGSTHRAWHCVTAIMRMCMYRRSDGHTACGSQTSVMRAQAVPRSGRARRECHVG